MSDIPTTMRALGVRKYSSPSGYEILEVPVPTIKDPKQLLIKVHAAVIATSDTQFAAGYVRWLTSFEMPHKLGITGSGVVVAVGSEVRSVKVGDPVHGCIFKRPLLPFIQGEEGGFCVEYAITKEHLVLPKPSHMTFEDAAGLASPAVVIYQMVQHGLRMIGQPASWLEGKTVFVPGALSNLGMAAVQVFKTVYGVGKVISTVSTAKMGLVDQYLPPGTVDQLIDYQTQDIVKEVGRGTVDFVYNTQWSGLTGLFPLANPETGVIMSATTPPAGKQFKEFMGPGNTPFFVCWIADLVNMYYRWLLRGTKVKLGSLSGNLADREALEAVGEWIALGKIKAVNTVVELDDLEMVKKECVKVAKGKGGLGKLVIKIV